MIPGFLHAPNLEAPLVMGVGPIQAEHLAPPAAMIRGNHHAVMGHEHVCSPSRFKDCLMHRAAGGSLVVFPYLQVVDPLEGLMRTQNQACQIPADVFETSLSTKDVTILGHPLADGSWHANDRQHTLFPLSSAFSSCFYLPLWRLLRQEPSKSCHERLNGVGVEGPEREQVCSPLRKHHIAAIQPGQVI